LFAGRTLLNQRKLCTIKLLSDKRKAKNVTSKPTLESFQVIHESLTIAKIRKTSIRWRQPTHVGAAILDYAKLCMYEFYCGYMAQKFLPENMKLLFTDTDSLCFELTVPNLYEYIKDDVDEHFDTSNYEQTNVSYSDKNKMRIGYFKDELAGKQAVEFVGLKSKMYSIKMCDEEEKMTCKGVSKFFVKNHLRHEHYKQVLYNDTETSANFMTINSKTHRLFTKENVKKCLSSYDDKHFITVIKDDSNNICRMIKFPFGHKNIVYYRRRNL